VRSLKSVRAAVFAIVASVVALTATSPPANAAGDKAAAKKIFRKGVTEYNLGHFEDAITDFEQAYELDHSPILLFNIGQSHRKLGHNDRALFFFKRYLVENPKAKDRAEVEKWIGEIEESLKAERARVPPDTGSASAVTPPAPPAPSGVGSSAATPDAQKQPAPFVAASPNPDEGKSASVSWQRPAAWTTAALAAAALGFAAFETIKYEGYRGDFENIAGCGETAPMRGADPGCMKAYDDGEHAKTLAITGYVTAGVLGGVAALLFATSGNAEPKASMASGCRVNGLAASCRLAF
jgi:tetratricopeptide (TPR) repeat protein